MDILVYKDKVKVALEAYLSIENLPSEVDVDFPVFLIPKDKVFNAIEFLKKDPSLSLSFLTTMFGIHYPDHLGQEFALVYQLHNMKTNERVRIRTVMAKDDLVMPSITPIFAGANWMEREAFDFYGFTFTGHPNLARILNMDEMNYHPMRKEYRLEDEGRSDKDDKYFGR